MEMESSDVKKKWSKVWKLAETEHVIINYYNKPVAVLISWGDYNRLTEANKLTENDDSKYASLATEAMKKMSSMTDTKYKDKNNKTVSLCIKCTMQAEEFIINLKHNSKHSCYKNIKIAICSKKRLRKVTDTYFYKREVDGLRVIYTISGVNIIVAYIEEMERS
jgi:prevent-host-death family protein